MIYENTELIMGMRAGSEINKNIQKIIVKNIQISFYMQNSSLSLSNIINNKINNIKSIYHTYTKKEGMCMRKPD